MPTKFTIHCDCGTDVRTEPTGDAIAAESAIVCPDCESVFAARIIELETDHDASSARHGTRSSRGP
ncbi:hypothetical protein [Natrialba swarupiae]|uniref:Uncharacterized protein n=1 Tax=Natrialba swarupiae TaxID=2448032 RepID=A0A5D5AQ05_9EURY|nr:hypothetical protein [Natrialba swarupiae]MCW8171928.1 hypothetical protein [Natrialba swarupiae]TYT63736.1 hypothetical protein FYC77_00475 [Natrialba swarupiae]